MKRKFLLFMSTILLMMTIMEVNVNVNAETSIGTVEPTMASPKGWTPPGVATSMPTSTSKTIQVEEDEVDYDDLRSTYLKSGYDVISEIYPKTWEIKLTKMLKKGVKGKFSSLTPKLFKVRSNKIVFKKNTYGVGTLNVKINDGGNVFNIKIQVIHYPELDISGIRRVNKNTIQLRFKNFKKGVNLNQLDGKSGIHVIQRNRNKKDKRDKVTIVGLGKERTVRDYKKTSDRIHDVKNVKIKVYGKKGTEAELCICLGGMDNMQMGYRIICDIKLKDVKKLKKNKWYGEKTLERIVEFS